MLKHADPMQISMHEPEISGVVCDSMQELIDFGQLKNSKEPFIGQFSNL